MRHLHLTIAEVRRYREDLTPEGYAWRLELLDGAQKIANAFGDMVAVVLDGNDERIVALLLPKLLKQDAQDLDGDRNADAPPALGEN